MKRLFFVAAASLASLASAEPVERDVVVYGGTSGGVVAAVQAARCGKSVALVSPTAHLGGLTSSGLGWTDLGKSSILGGLSREFYHRLYLHYQQESAWVWQTRDSYGNAGQGGPAFNSSLEIASVFEPKVAEAVFSQLLAEQTVTVVTGRLDLAQGVVMGGGKIARIRLEDGREYAGKMFIDASYEGDLLPGAGVTFTVGREANATYGETVNGIQAAGATKNQLRDQIDPYVVPGDPASGLLAGVNPAPGAPVEAEPAAEAVETTPVAPPEVPRDTDGPETVSEAPAEAGPEPEPAAEAVETAPVAPPEVPRDTDGPKTASGSPVEPVAG